MKIGAGGFVEPKRETESIWRKENWGAARSAITQKLLRQGKSLDEVRKQLRLFDQQVDPKGRK